ncbi:efflux RND transporter permease subunit, partial [Klebsiella pneumoniae]|nr:efflux RND transporter permease subunit [Klebsiella pneumoniae]
MNSLPRDMQRPKVIKASATDIPVLYLSMTQRGGESEAGFLELARVADNSVRHRLEQLPEVAMVDVTGIPERMLRIVPDPEKTEASGITRSMIESALTTANVTPGSMTVREGYYEYNVSVANRLRTPEDVADIYIRHGERLIRLGDIARVELVEREPDGISEYGGKRAVTLAVIKQNEENIDKLKQTLSQMIERMESEYPEISFSVTRNQT